MKTKDPVYNEIREIREKLTAIRNELDDLGRGNNGLMLPSIAGGLTCLIVSLHHSLETREKSFAFREIHGEKG